MKTKTILALLLLVVMGCSKNDFNVQNIDFITISQGTLTGNENIPKQNLVISNQTDFDILIKKMNTINTNLFSEKEIDFSKYQIIAVFDEIKRSGHSDMMITKIVEQKDYIEVFINETIKEGAVINQPYHIVKTSKYEKKITLRK